MTDVMQLEKWIDIQTDSTETARRGQTQQNNEKQSLCLSEDSVLIICH